jgi:hypothetical protein
MLGAVGAARVWQRHRQLRSLGVAFREDRGAASTAACYAPARGGESSARVDARAARTPPGMRVLGDVTRTRVNQPAETLRYFLDDAGTTWGAVGTTGATPIMNLWSTDDDTVWLTQATFRRGVQVAGAPFIQPAWVTSAKGHLHALAAHRKRIPSTLALRPLRTLDHVCAWLTEHTHRIAAWRYAQAPNALLEWDLRQLLGPRYDHDARAVARHLQIDLPAARLLP